MAVAAGSIGSASRNVVGLITWAIMPPLSGLGSGQDRQDVPRLDEPAWTRPICTTRPSAEIDAGHPLELEMVRLRSGPLRGIGVGDRVVIHRADTHDRVVLDHVADAALGQDQEPPRLARGADRLGRGYSRSGQSWV